MPARVQPASPAMASPRKLPFPDIQPSPGPNPRATPEPLSPGTPFAPASDDTRAMLQHFAERLAVRAPCTQSIWSTSARSDQDLCSDTTTVPSSGCGDSRSKWAGPLALRGLCPVRVLGVRRLACCQRDPALFSVSHPAARAPRSTSLPSARRLMLQALEDEMQVMTVQAPGGNNPAAVYTPRKAGTELERIARGDAPTVRDARQLSAPSDPAGSARGVFPLPRIATAHASPRCSPAC